MNHVSDHPPVSLYANAKATHGTTITFAEFAARVRSDEFQERCWNIRNEPNKVLANAIKAALLAITPSGQFTQRNRAGLIQHSGIVCADIDGLSDMHVADELRNRFKNDPCVLFTFISPSGRGVKVFFRVDPSRPHLESWKAVEKYVRDEYGHQIDPSTKDVCRLCYFSHDPHACLAEGEVEIVTYPEVGTPPALVVTTNSPASLTPGDDYNNRGDVPALLRKFGWTSTDGVHWTRPGKSPEEGNSATLGHEDGPPNALFCFSPNAAPIVPGKYHTPLDLFTVLECGGDYAAASAALAKLGFGPPLDEGFLILPSASGLSFSAAAAKIFPVIAAKHSMFSRGRVPHEVVGDGNGFRLEPVTKSAFRSRLEKHGRVMAWRVDSAHGRKLVPALCPEETAGALLATTEARDLLPPIRVITASPTLVLAGDELLVLGSGYNPQGGGVFVTGSTSPPAVSFHAAVTMVLGILEGFDFQSPGDRSRAIAAILTRALKMAGLIAGSTPVEIIEANLSQTGKGFLLKLIAAIYGEVPSIVTQKEGGVGSMDEAISAALIAGRPFIQIDNLRGKLASAHLEAIVTADGPVQCREPHRGVVDVDVRPFTFSLTSNGVETTADLANRSSIIRLKKRPAGYAFAEYPEGGLLDHVKANQPYVLGCVFAVVGEWFIQGCPRTNECRHDFRPWAQSLDWIVTNLFGAAPLMDGHSEARDRVSDQGRSWLRAVTIAVAEENRLDHEMNASELAELSGEHDIPIPSCRPDVDDTDRARAVGKTMGRLFKGVTEVQLEGFNVVRRIQPTADGKDGKLYRFTTTT